MAVASPAITPPACASCVFGAARTSLLSFHMQQIDTVTLELIPHITVFPDGHRETSYAVQTISGTEFIHTGRTGVKTYTDPSDITWMYYDATLTYPTTYVHYIAFSGGVAKTTTGSGTCAAAADATAVSVPEGLSAAPFIRPLGPDSDQLPLELLLYLQDVPAVSAQFAGDALTGCAPLRPGGMPGTASLPASTRPPTPPGVGSSSTLTSSVSRSALSSSGDSTSTGWSETASSSSSSSLSASTSSSTLSPTTAAPTPITSSTPTPFSNSTISSTSSSSVPQYSYSALPSFSRPVPEISSSVAAPTSAPAHSTPNPQGPPTTHTKHINPPGPTSTTTQEPHTFLSSPSPEPPSTRRTEPPRTGSPEPSTQATLESHDNDHSTAWVISTVTGPAIVTTLHPRGDGESTRTPNNDIPPVTQPHINTNQGHSPVETPKPGGPQQGVSTPEASPGGGSHQTVQGASPGGSNTNANGGGVTTQHNQQPQQQQPPQRSPKTVYNLPGTTLTANSNGGVDYDGHTVLPGQTVTVFPGTGANGGGGNGGAAPKTIVALPGTGSSGPKVVVDGTTYSAHTTTPAPVSPGVHDNSGNGGNDDGESYEATLTANGHVLTILQHGASMTVEDTAAHKTTVCDTSALPITFEGQTLSLSAHAAGDHAATATITGKASTGKPDGGVVYVNGIPAATLTPSHDSPPDGGSKTTMTLAVFTAADGEVVTALRRPGGFVVLEDKASTVTVKDSATTSFAGERIVVARDGSSVVIGGGGGADGKDGTRVWTEKLSTVTSSIRGPATSGATGDVVKGGAGTAGRGRGGGGGRRGGGVVGTHGDSGASGSLRGSLSKTAVLGLVVLGLVGGVVVGL